MTTPQDAFDKQLALSPAYLEAIADNPDELVKLTRVQLAMVNYKMVSKLLGNQESTPSQYVAVSDQLRKTVSLNNATDGGVGAGFSINITLTGNQPASHTRERVVN